MIQLCFCIRYKKSRWPTCMHGHASIYGYMQSQILVFRVIITLKSSSNWSSIRFICSSIFLYNSSIRSVVYKLHDPEITDTVTETKFNISNGTDKNFQLLTSTNKQRGKIKSRALKPKKGIFVYCLNKIKPTYAFGKMEQLFGRLLYGRSTEGHLYFQRLPSLSL